jgi:hypothetical protein
MDRGRKPSAGSAGLVTRLARIGAVRGDETDEALRKETLVLSAAVITALATIWVVTYASLGLSVAAAIRSPTSSSRW